MSEFATGYIPRDYKSFPMGCSRFFKKWDLPLLEMKEAAELAEHNKALGIDPLSVAIRRGALPTYQNGFGYCWAHAGTFGLKVAIAQTGQAVPRLSATMPAALIKGYRDRGGNAFDIVPFLYEHGAPTVDFWAENKVDRSLDTPEMRANARLHRIVEWYELPDQSDQHKWTALANNFCLWSGYVNIGHAMCSARFRVENGQPVSDDVNSWSKEASNASEWNEGWMRDKKVIYKRKGRDFRCFEQYAIRVSTTAA